MITDPLRARIRDAFAEDGETAIAMIEMVARARGADATQLALAVLARGQASINRFRAELRDVEASAPHTAKQ